MNKHSPVKADSLLERAAAIYDFGAALRRPVAFDAPAANSADVAAPAPTVEAQPTKAPQAEERAVPAVGGRVARIDRDRLREGGFIVPEAPVGSLPEEFRIIKRQLLAAMKDQRDVGDEQSRTLLVCSAQAGEGKTFCAINLALSLAAERDLEVLLVDGDFNKPEIFSLFGLKPGPGLIDAIGSADMDVERLVVPTDVKGLSLLSAGRAANNVTELLGSVRTRQVLEDLVRGNPRRILLFDSPPALMASPASVLAAYAGQLLLVVRADRTTESDLRDATNILSACQSVSLMLNGEAFAGGRRYGNYYGYGQ